MLLQLPSHPAQALAEPEHGLPRLHLLPSYTALGTLGLPALPVLVRIAVALERASAGVRLLVFARSNILTC